MNTRNEDRPISAIKPIQSLCALIPAGELEAFFQADPGPIAWLEKAARAHNLRFLLAHQDDGVIWGRFDAVGDSRKLYLSSKLIPESPPFMLERLQQLRAFGEAAEIIIWRAWRDDAHPQGWHARLIEDGVGLDEREYFDEEQILWGTDGKPCSQDSSFTEVWEGQGLRHAVPLNLTEDGFKQGRASCLYRPLRLKLRHYLAADDDGAFRVTLSRLVDLAVNGKGGS